METKNKQEVVERIQRRLEFKNLSLINPEGKAGGLAILWDEEIDVEVESSSKMMFTVRCSDRARGISMKVILLHAPNDFQERLKLWQEIEEIQSGFSQPWVCMGDFNEILYTWEKQGTRGPENYRMEAFREFVDRCELMDMESKGCMFTWSNHREGEEQVRKRLDRALCSMEWRVEHPEAEVVALPAIGSDHSPLLLNLQPVRQRRERKFRFEDFWLDNPDCKGIVKEAWEGQRLRREDLVFKVRRVGTTLSKWSKKTFPKACTQIERLKKRLTDLTNDTTGDSVEEERRKVIEQIDRLWRQEEDYWRMRSRVQWLKKGDRNTKFFHATTIQRRQRNRISALKLNETTWCREEYQLQQHVKTFYEQLFSTTGARDFQPVIGQLPLVVDRRINDELLAPVSMEEVREAAFQLGATKAPGPDGLNGLFYQQYWEDIKHDVFNVVREFFESGRLHPTLNETNIVLIPKVNNPESITEFRPISLCNFNYKIISKVMANRLKIWLPSLIAGEQSAFVGGRLIQDNIMIVQEVLHQLRTRQRQKKFQAIVKLDMQKAYDRVEWDYLCACLRKMGFSAHWTELIRSCISTVSYSIQMNGQSLPPFQPTRGLRQGDPLSPYLFILLANSLSTMMNSAMENGILKGIKLKRSCPTLSHLLFADDAIFFLEGTIGECQNFMQVLNQYCYASGQAVNLNKSGVYFSRGCPETLKRNLAATLRVQVLDRMGKYLGIPSDWGQTKKQMFSWILSRVERKLEGWKEKFLTTAGKEILIKTVVQALPQYAMSLFKIPVALCKAIESKIANFWWKQSSSKQGVHWKRWEELKKPKAEGGMGFKDLILFNIAMLGKQVWRMAGNPEALWCRVFKGIYFPNGDVWKARTGGRPSWGWRSILMGREAVEKDVKWVVSTGTKIKIREDRWLNSRTIGGPANRTDPIMVGELIQPETNQWNQEQVRTLFPEEVAIEVLATPICQRLGNDKQIWQGNAQGTYNVKSGYHRIQSSTQQTLASQASSSYQIPQVLWKIIWKLPIFPKVRNFMWKICKNALASKENLLRRSMVPDSECPICKAPQESVEHLFLECDWTKHVWNDPKLMLNSDTESTQRMDRWVLEALTSRAAPATRALVANVCWGIWKGRNGMVFKNTKPRPDAILAEAEVECDLYLRSMQAEGRRRRERRYAHELGPNRKAWTFHVDCSWTEHTRAGSIAGDREGRLIAGFAETEKADSVVEMEALAICRALKLLAGERTREVQGRTKRGLKEIAVDLFSDSACALQLMENVERSPWATRPVIVDCRNSLTQLNLVQLRYTPRESNKAADWIAKAHRSGTLPPNWLMYPPRPLRDIICLDMDCLNSFSENSN